MTAKGPVALWASHAIEILERDLARSADTHLLRVDLPFTRDIQLYFKDESTHPSGSLKHRLARSLFLHGICSGWIGAETPIVEASSGNTATAEAYFAKLLGLRFIAVMPRSTARDKIELIRFFGGECELVDQPGAIYERAEALAREVKGHYMDQFKFAERAVDWRANNNIAESIFQQMAQEPHPLPRWIVVSAGTGGTAATIGRYARYRRTGTQLLVADPENSVFFDYWRTGDPGLRCARGSRIEGIGRPRVEESFLRGAVDEMLKVPDAASIAAVRFLESVIGRKCGGSTGTNFYAALVKIVAMHRASESGSVVTLIGDSGLRYRETYFSDEWLAREGISIGESLNAIASAFRTGSGNLALHVSGLPERCQPETTHGTSTPKSTAVAG